MAVVFDTSLPENEILNSHNNNEVIFNSDAAATELSATIAVAGIVDPFEIQPINGDFFFNFKPAFIRLFNELYFNDTIEPDIVAADPTSLLYDGSEIYMAVEVTYTITLDVGGPDVLIQNYIIVQSALDILDFAKGIDIFSFDFNLLSIPDERSNFSFSAVYFEGHPFDVTIHHDNPALQTLTHLETGSTLDLTFVDNITRLFFSDGSEDITINDYIPVLDNAMNTYIWDDPNSVTMNVEKIEGNCNGIYLKWKMTNGGWAYWLFDNLSETVGIGQSSGELNRNFQRYENSGFFNELGKESTVRYRVRTDFLRGKYRRLVTSILDSPRVYFYAGERYVRADAFNWIPFRLNTQQTLIKTRKNEFDPLEFEFELFFKDVLTL